MIAAIVARIFGGRHLKFGGHQRVSHFGHLSRPLRLLKCIGSA
jgi:hypothetical protein